MPSGRSGLTISSSVRKPSIAPTTSSVRSIDVPIGSSSSALKKGRSDGGKKSTGTNRKPVIVRKKTATTATTVNARRFKIAVRNPR